MHSRLSIEIEKSMLNLKKEMEYTQVHSSQKVEANQASTKITVAWNSKPSVQCEREE